MTDRVVPLERLHDCSRHVAQPQFEHAGRVIGWGGLCTDVARLRSHIEAAPAVDWALHDDSAYPFTVALLALLGAGRRAWLPADATAGTQQKLSAFCDGWLGPHWSSGQPISTDTATGTSTGTSTGTDGSEARLAALTGRIVVFTSGSTGDPQPIAKSLGQFDREIESLEALWGEWLADATVRATVSHQHIYGLLFRVLWPLCAGRISHSERFVDAAALLHDAAKPIAWVASPAHLRRLPRDLARAAAEPLRAVFSSGGRLPATTADDCARRLGHWPMEVYGSSESGGIAWRTQADGNSWWRPLPGVDVRTGDDGALELRSPHLPADDPVLQLGDSVELASDGRFCLGERLDRIVKVEGKRLSLSELESVLCDHAWIAEARALLFQRQRESVAVVAVPSACGDGELARLGRHAFSRRLREALLSRFDPVTLPRLWRFVDALPRDPQGKVSERSLAGLFERPVPRRLPALMHQSGDARASELHLRISPDLGCLEGHFPQVPVVPGVALMAWAEHYARHCFALTATVRDIERVKFNRLVRPGDELELCLDHDDVCNVIGYRFRLLADAVDVASGRLLFAAS